MLSHSPSSPGHRNFSLYYMVLAYIQFNILPFTSGSLCHVSKSQLPQNIVKGSHHILLLLPNRGTPNQILETLTFNKFRLNKNFPQYSQSIYGSFKYRRTSFSSRRVAKRKEKGRRKGRKLNSRKGGREQEKEKITCQATRLGTYKFKYLDKSHHHYYLDFRDEATEVPRAQVTS